MKRVFLVSLSFCLLLSVLTGCFGAAELYKDATDVANDSVGMMDSLSVEIFNAKFMKYEGKDLKSTRVESFMSTISLNNENEPDHKVNLIYKSLSGEEITNFNDKTILSENHKYNIEISKYNEDGSISEMIITEL